VRGIFPHRRVISSGGGAPPLDEIIFRADFSDSQPPGADEPFQYNFTFKYPATDVVFAHLATGAYDGGPACQITVLDGTGGNATDGWGFEGTDWTNFCTAASSGTSFFVRFTYSNPSGQLWAYSNKLMIFGSEDGRSVVFQRYAPTSGFNCTLGGGGGGTLNNPPDFGFDGSVTTWDHASVDDEYYGLDITQNVSTNGAGPILIGNAGSEKPVGSGIPADGIYHIQIQVTIGASGVAAYRIWSNNNTQGSPDQALTTGFAISVTDFTTLDHTGFVGMVFGDEGTTISGNYSWIFHRFEVGETFDSTWYPS
jgi:hypothetical protein